MRVITEQKSTEWELRKYYWKLYGEHEARVDKEEILQNIEDLTKLETEDCRKLECEITEGKVSVTLKNTKFSGYLSWGKKTSFMMSGMAMSSMSLVRNPQCPPSTPLLDPPFLTHL